MHYFSSHAREIKDSNTQTVNYKTEDVGCSTTEAIHISTQTDGQILDGRNELPSTPPGLETWLKNIGPLMLKQLSSKEKTSIFTGHDHDYYQNGEQESRIKLIQKLVRPENDDKITFANKDTQENTQLIESVESNQKFSVIAICWSPSGKSLAVGYGLPFHDDWCQHKGCIQIFIESSMHNILNHYAELKLPSCTSDLAYHPTDSTIFAASTVSGDICVWNMQQEISGPMNSSCNEHLPSKVSSMLWLPTDQAEQFLLQKETSGKQVLVTGCVNGSITIWLISKVVSTLNIVKLKRYNLHGSMIKTQMTPDISCMDFSIPAKNSNNYKSDSWNIDTFVVGCKTGQMFLCQASKSKHLTDSADSDPCVNSLEPHGGCVLNLSFSSSNRSLLLTLGADLEIRLYHVPQDYPLKVICLESQLSCVTWIPGSEKFVIGSVGQCKRNTQNMLQVFDVSAGKQLLTVPADECESSTDPSNLNNLLPNGITSLASNSKNPTTLACGNMHGVVFVWNLPHWFTE